MTDYKMINQDDYDKIRLHFEMMDKNKDGKITRQEILEVLSKGNKKVDMKAVNDLIDKSDVNKDGYISWNEFLAMMTKKKEKEALKKEQEAEKLSSRHIDEEESLMAFKMFDSDNNGLISFDELQQAMKVKHCALKANTENETLAFKADDDKDFIFSGAWFGTQSREVERSVSISRHKQ